MDTKDLLKKVRKIEIKTRRLSNDVFGGAYHSTFKGRGMTFSEVRQYQFGDDVRSIDWNVTARYNEPYIKVFEEERELTLMLVVDISASQDFGTQEAFKREILTEIAATIAFSATQNNDKIGLLLFSDQVELFIPPKKGKSHVLRIIRELLEFEPKGSQTSLKIAMEYLNGVLKKKAIVFVLSDFIDDGYESPLRIAGQKHDLTAIRIYDTHEEKIPDLGIILVKDAETGLQQYVNTSDKEVRKQYNSYYKKQLRYLKKCLTQSGSGLIELSLKESYVTKLLSYFKHRS